MPFLELQVRQRPPLRLVGTETGPKLPAGRASGCFPQLVPSQRTVWGRCFRGL